MRRGLGDTLSRAAVRQLHEATLFGHDVDPRMVRLATMNLSLRGLDRVRILRRDALTRSLDRSAKADLGLPVRGFDVVLANPPFSGRLDADRIVEDVKIGRTRQTELLFLQYMLNHLKDCGRCGVVVPEGVLFGSDRRASRVAPQAGREQPGRGGFVAAGRRVQPVFGRQDIRAGRPQGAGPPSA